VKETTKVFLNFFPWIFDKVFYYWHFNLSGSLSRWSGVLPCCFSFFGPYRPMLVWITAVRVGDPYHLLPVRITAARRPQKGKGTCQDPLLVPITAARRPQIGWGICRDLLLIWITAARRPQIGWGICRDLLLALISVARRPQIGWGICHDLLQIRITAARRLQIGWGIPDLSEFHC
jgi:hypothetical protein